VGCTLDCCELATGGNIVKKDSAATKARCRVNFTYSPFAQFVANL